MPRAYMRRSRRRVSRRRTRTSRRAYVRNVRRIAFSIPERKYYEYWFNPQIGIPAPDLLTDDHRSQVFAIAHAPIWRAASLLAPLPQGVDNGERIGAKIHVRYVQLSVTIVPVAAANGDLADRLGMLCRYVVARDRLANTSFNNTVVTPPQLFQNQSAAPISGSTTTIQNTNHSLVGDFRYRDNLGRFKIYADQQHVAAQTTEATVAAPRIVQHFIKVGRTFTYGAGTLAAAELQSFNKLTKGDLLWFSNVNQADCCVVGVQVRICYTDA